MVFSTFSVHLDGWYFKQLDIIAEFEMPKEVLEEMLLGGAAEVYNCSTSGGAAQRGLMGPFGLLVLADQNLSEQLAVYFYIGKGEDGRLQTFFCQDELKYVFFFSQIFFFSIPFHVSFKWVSFVIHGFHKTNKQTNKQDFMYIFIAVICRSSKANDLVKGVFGSIVPVISGESLSMRILVSGKLVIVFSGKIKQLEQAKHSSKQYLFIKSKGSSKTPRTYCPFLPLVRT